MIDFLNNKPATAEAIFDSAFLHAIAQVASDLYDDLTDRYYFLKAWEHFSLALTLNPEFCQEFESRLASLLGKTFFKDLVVKLKDLVNKPKSSQLTIEAGIPVAYFPSHTDYTYDDSVLATNYGIELSVQILQKLHSLKAYKKLKDCRKPKDFKKSINFLESLLGAPNTDINIKIPPIIWDNPQTESIVKPQIFKDKPLEPMSSALPIIYALESQTRLDKWKNSDLGAIYPEKASKHHAEIIELYVSNSGDIKILPWEEAEQIIDKFGLATAKMHLIFAACCMGLKEPWKDKFEINGSEIIKLFGWEKRTDLSYSRRLKEVAQLAFTLSCLVAKVTWEEGKNKKGKIIATCPTGRIWDVAVTPKGQLNADGQIDIFEEVVLTIRPGVWTEVYLNKAGYEGRTALYQFSWLSQSVLKIDSYRNEMALRLALHLSLKNRCHKTARYKVGTLLSEILPQSEFDSAKSDRRRGSELKQRWDKTLVLLASLGWSVTYDETYPKYLQPGSDQERNPEGYLKVLFDAIITIQQPAPIPALLQSRSIEVTQETSPTTQSEELTGARIREFRKAKGWTQRYLAELLGVSQSLIKLLEQEKRSILPEINQKIKKLMEAKI